MEIVTTRRFELKDCAHVGELQLLTDSTFRAVSGFNDRHDEEGVVVVGAVVVGVVVVVDVVG